MTLKNTKSGFTLIEIAIIMVIAGFFMLMLIKVYEQYVTEKKQAELVKKVDQVTSALAYYIQDEGIALDENGNPLPNNGATVWDESLDPTRYPCPAGPNLDATDPEFGLELRRNNGICDVRDGVVQTGPAANPVFIGAVPAVTLGISTSQMFDQYNNPFTYAVSGAVSDASIASPPNGALGDGNQPGGSIIVEKVNDAGVATALNGVPFVLVSHGEDRGASCDDTNPQRDQENCDNDRRFSDAMEFRSNDFGSANYYDDTIVVSLRGLHDKEEYWGLGTDTTDLIALNTGNIGIGITDPSQRVDVNGRVRAHSYLHASDKKLKTNIADMSSALNKIEDIHVVTYDYKDRTSEHKKMGVIAQEIDNIYPEVVFKGKDGYLSVDYVSLTAPIIKALQELSEKQRNEIKALQAQIDDLSKQLQNTDIKQQNGFNYHNSKEIYYND